MNKQEKQINRVIYYPPQNALKISTLYCKPFLDITDKPF